ncbi:MAG: thioesterase family protein [Bacillota bacterium]|nr:thioesterase family protein [Bacillota bacterium]
MTRRVTWRDCDMMGHVNNAVYFTYFEEARTLWLEEALEGALDGSFPMVLAEARCTFRSPARFGERLRIGLRVGEVRSSAFTLEYRVEGEDGRAVASGETVQVLVDRASGRARRLPDGLRRLLEASRPAAHPAGS